MKTVKFYRAKIDFWENWLQESRATNHKELAERLLESYRKVLPEAEEYWKALKEIQSKRVPVPCEGPGCQNTFPPRGHKKTCSEACRKALFDQHQRKRRRRVVTRDSM